MALSERHLAIVAMLVAVVIYGTNFAISRHAVLNGFTTFDMAALRFGVAGVIMFPLLVKWGIRDCAGIGWGRGLVLALLSGVPLTLLMIYGLSLSPASHGATMTPGTVTVIGALGGYLMFGVRPGRLGVLGIAIVISGLTMIAIAGTTSGSRNIILGDLCFFLAGLVWGFFPLLLQRWKVDGLRATAPIAVVSMVVFLPFYFWQGGGNLAQVPLWMSVAHGFNQGVLNVIVGLWLWGYAVEKVGAARSGRFPPLIPVIGTLCAIPLLGEWPGPLQWIGIALIVTGLALTTRR